MPNLEISGLETIILCGGQGSRLKELTSNRQKCMLDVNGKPFMEFVVKQLQSFGLQDFIFATGKCSEEIEEKFSDIGIISKEDSPLGTGGAVKNALKYVKGKHFLVVNGDSYLNFTKKDFTDFINWYNDEPLILIAPVDNCEISSFFELDHEQMYGTGFYIFPKSVFDNIPDKCSLEHDLLWKFPTRDYFILEECSLLDIGIKENLDKAETFMRIR